jgi:hypothetical protein
VSLFGPTSAEKWGEAGPRNRVLPAPDGKLSKLEVAPVLSAARSLLPGGASCSAAESEPDTDTTTFALGAKR